MRLSKHVLLLCSICLLIAMLPANKVFATSTVVAVDPSTSTVVVGATFNVNVNVTNVQTLTSWQFKIYYLNSVLNCTGITEGPFLKNFGSTTWPLTVNITNNYNSTYGRVLAADALLGNGVSVNGSGVLATLSFSAVAKGQSVLHLDNTLLGDTNLPPIDIPHTTSDGSVTVESGTLVHDVAVTKVALGKTVIGKGYDGNITATAANLGGYAETFNITVYAYSSYIASSNVTLSNGNSINVTFTWNTTGFAYGNFTVSAYAWPVPGETNTADNNCTGGWIIISILGDITGPTGWPDGVVNMRDIALIARCFGSSPGSGNWNPNTDLNNDGVVNMKDIALVARNFGNHYP